MKGITKSGHRERLEVQQLGGRGVFLGQDEVSEGYGQHGFGVQPAVRHHLEEVLGRQRVEERGYEGDHVLFSRVRFAKEERFVVQDTFSIHILQDDPEQQGVLVDLSLIQICGLHG